MLLRNTFRAFRHRDYFIFWCGLFLGHTGTLVQATAQSWLIFQLTNSPFYLGLEGLCLGLPRVVFSPLGGAIVDRANRKILFVVTQTAFLLMALFLGVMDYLGTIRVWHVLSISALTGFFVSFEQPVRQSILHQLVPRSELPNAVTLLSDGLQWIDALRTVDRRSADSLYRYQRLLFRRDNWKRNRASYDLHDSHRRNSTTDKQNHRVARYGRGVGFGMEHPGSFIPFHCPRNRHFLHQAVHSIHAGFARDILQVGAPGLGLLLMAPGAGAILEAVSPSRLFAAFRDRITCFFLAAGFGSSIIFFAASRHFLLSLFFLFFAGGFQTTFLSSVATLLQIQSTETNRGRMMSLSA